MESNKLRQLFVYSALSLGSLSISETAEANTPDKTESMEAEEKLFDIQLDNLLLAGSTLTVLLLALKRIGRNHDRDIYRAARARKENSESTPRKD